jgi:hypothetical protein
MCREEFYLDFDVIKTNADAFDLGQKTQINRIAKMIWTAYEQGHNEGIVEAQHNFNNMNILLFGEAGNA